ncbi:MAG: serine acetyltransferase, partial [Luteimonas sp.]
MLRCILLGEAPWLCESYNLLFWLRTSRYTGADTWLRYTVYPFARYMLYRLTRRMGVWIPPSTRIGSGLRLWHCGGIFVNGHAVIGRNCNISQGVTIGQANRGHPVLGDNVYIGPGAKIVGAVRIGHNVAIGANCVVTRDVPDNAVVV